MSHSTININVFIFIEIYLYIYHFKSTLIFTLYRVSYTTGYTMQTIPYVKKKIGSSYFVWFQKSNLYFHMKEPAWFVFSKTIKRYKASTIAQLCTLRYNTSIEESLSFVHEIQSEIEKRNTPTYAPNKMDLFSPALHQYHFDPFSIRQYKLGNQHIIFSYESSLFESYIHPLIAHFETTATHNDLPLFELFRYQEQIAFRFNGETKGLWAKDETQFVKGLIFMFLVNAMHNKTDDDWLMTVHASAVTNGKKTILFTADPGKGKTTFAALMHTHGFQLISDDFVPIDRHQFNAYPFPISMSVKPGSMDLLTPIFPILEEKTVTHLSPEKMVRYIPPANHLDVIHSIFPVRELIFIEYNSSVDFHFEILDPVIALKSLLDQAWVTPISGNSIILLDRVMEMSFYKLTYSNNAKALEAITNLFEHD